MSAQVETQDRSIRSARLEMPCLPVEVTSQPFPHDISSRNLFSGTVHKQKKEKKKRGMAQSTEASVPHNLSLKHSIQSIYSSYCAGSNLQGETFNNTAK